MAFNPNRTSLKKCLKRLRAIQKEYKVDTRKILTSRDPVIKKLAQSKLKVKNVPDGFTKTILPVFFEKASTLYISTGVPNAKVPRHSHDEGDGIRFIMSGSILYKGRELTAGDWMFIPAGAEYKMSVGPQGATMCYCYCCCCT